MTIYDIAREAGVSASTVSRVINHKPGIKESTRQRVQELLERYHYTPDISARGLVTQASRFIGILIEDIRVEHHTESAYVLEQAMTAKGYTCITFSTGPQPERKAQYIQILEQRRVEGVFLIGSMFGTPEVRQSIAQHMHGIPVVLVNGELDLPNAYNVLADEQQGTADCVALLAEAGRCRPAYLMDTDTPANRNKVCGFRQGLARCGLHPNAPILTEKDTGPDPRSAIARGRRGNRCPAGAAAGHGQHPLRHRPVGHRLPAGAAGPRHCRTAAGGRGRRRQHPVWAAVFPCPDHTGQPSGRSESDRRCPAAGSAAR